MMLSLTIKILMRLMTLMTTLNHILQIIILLSVRGSSQSRSNSTNYASLESIYRSTVTTISSAMTGITLESCPLVHNIVEALTMNLHQYIAGQEEAVNTVINAVSAWELTRKSNQGKALVLAFTGPTGVGKSETSFRLADALLAAKKQLGRRRIPEGMLILRGEDFSSTSKIAALGVGEIHKHVIGLLRDHYLKCDGNAVIIFDEVQKVIPGALEVFNQMLGDRGYISIPAEMSYYCKTIFGCASTIDISTTNSIFIFISDIAVENMIKALLAYRERNLIPRGVIRTIVKDALDSQWDRLQFGKHITEVVPFLPLEIHHVQTIFGLKVRQLGLEHRYKYWWNLIVDDAVLEYLSSAQYVKYTQHSTKVIRNKDTSELDDVVSVKVFSTYGARGIENGPMQDLRAKLYSKMQPWRPQQLLHVGVTSETTATAIKGTYVSYLNFKPEIYLQWCSPDLVSVSGLSISEEMAMSEKCDTIWIGVIQG